MKKNTKALSPLAISLSGVSLVLGIALLIGRMMTPNLIVPDYTIPTMAVVSLVALAVETVFFGIHERCWIGSFVLAFAAFTVFPVLMGVVPAVFPGVLLGGLLGAVVFLICEVVYHSIMDRLASGNVPHMRVLASATVLLLILAVQAMSGMGL